MNQKVGRPTAEQPKNKVVSVRIDNSMLNILENSSSSESPNLAEIMRSNIPTILPSKHFNSMLCLNNLRELEIASDKCYEYLKGTSDFIHLSEIQERFPAYIFEYANDKFILHIKRPTYKVRAFRQRYEQGYNDIIETVKPYYTEGADYSIYMDGERMITFGDGWREEFKIFPEILCHQQTLNENEVMAKKIIEILEKSGIRCEIWPGYYVKPFPIIVKEIENEQYFKPINGIEQ